jgi:hypothetical protein
VLVPLPCALRLSRAENVLGHAYDVAAKAKSSASTTLKERILRRRRRSLGIEKNDV